MDRVLGGLVGIFRRATKDPAPVTVLQTGGMGGGLPPLGAKYPANLGWLWNAIYSGMGPPTGEGYVPVIVDEGSVMGLPAVMASLGLLHSYIGQMPLETVRETVTLIEPPAVIPSPAVLRNPLGDPRGTGEVFLDWLLPLITDLVFWGNYLAVLGPIDWTGWPGIVYPVPVGQWEVLQIDGVVRYRIGDLELDPSEVFHVTVNRTNGSLVGQGLLTCHRDTLAAAIAAERWAARYFDTGTIPSVHIAHPNPDLTQDQAQALKDKFVESARGRREPVVTPVGTEITVLPTDAESAQLVESRKWSAQSIAMAMGVPPAMLGLEAPSMTYRNIAEVNQQFINTTIMRYLTAIEQQLTAQLLPRGQRARFNTNALLRPDLGERIDQAIKAKDAGLVTVDEARGWLDLLPDESLGGTETEVTEVPATGSVTEPNPPTEIEQSGGPGAVPLALIGGSPQ